MDNLIPKSSIFRKLAFNNLIEGLLFFTIGLFAYVLIYGITAEIFILTKHPLTENGRKHLSAISASIGITIFLGLWLSSSTFSVLVSLVSFSALLTPWAHKLHL